MVTKEKRQTRLPKSYKRKNKGNEKNTVMQLLPFQNEARILTNRLLNAHRHPLFVSPTGTGKTITAIAIIADRIKLNQRIFVLTPQDEIFQQWLVQLSRYGIDYGYINQDGVTGRNKMEFKSDKGKLTRQQIIIIEYLREHGYNVAVVNSLDEVIDVLKILWKIII
jgi:superfamily II DNA or RNA helicase